MQMAFRVSDPSVAQNLQVGDKVTFSAAKVGRSISRSPPFRRNKKQNTGSSLTTGTRFNQTLPGVYLWFYVRFARFFSFVTSALE